AAGQRDAEGADPQQDAGTGLSLKRRATPQKEEWPACAGHFSLSRRLFLARAVQLLGRPLEKHRGQARRGAHQPEAEETDGIGGELRQMHRLTEPVELLG